MKFRIQVFDATSAMQWRDVAVINDDEAGVCWAFSSPPLEFDDLKVAEAVAAKVTDNCEVATQVVDADTGAVISSRAVQ